MNLLITGAWADAQKYIVEIQALGHKVVFMQWEKEELPCEYAWVEGVICNGLFLYHQIEKFPNLKFIQLTSAGYDRVNMPYIQDHHIVTYNAKGVYSTPMAEFAVMGVLSLYKRVFEFHEQQKRHEWKKIREIRELAGKRVVIVGCGDVGQECAKRFKAFGCKVIGVNRTTGKRNDFDVVFGLDRLDDELKLADIVIVAVALTKDTKGLVKAKNIKEDGILVNISRGGAVDLSDCKCEMILDVFEEEPLNEQSVLWEKGIITPHNSFVSEGNSKRLFNVIMQNLRKEY